MTGDLPGTSGGGAVIYPSPPISTPLSSNGGSEGQHRRTRHRRAGDVDNGAGAASDVFSHTAVTQYGPQMGRLYILWEQVGYWYKVTGMG